MFIVVRAFMRGYDQPTVSMAINVDQIVTFREGSIKFGPDKKERPICWMDTTRTFGIAIDCTLEQLHGEIFQAQMTGDK
jgi:hypothetical protein